MKRRGRAISGIVLLDKPPGVSSNRALQQARGLFDAQKAGHTGSLDPMATGMLPLCFGEATKVAGYLLGSAKAYLGEVRLGVTTDSDDAEGQVLQERPVPALSTAQIEAALAGLRGTISQTPPAYSAIKQGGIPLYRRARRGEAVQVPSRTVHVARLDLRGHQGDRLELYVECGAGTYVRSLARDLGECLGCGAHLTALRRLWVEPFQAGPMYSLDALAELRGSGGFAALDRALMPLEAGVTALPAVMLDADQEGRLRQGQQLQLCDLRSGLYRALDRSAGLVALVEIDPQGRTRVRRGFNAAQS